MVGENSKMAFSHFGICVADIEKATRFYREALGFTLGQSTKAGAPFEILTELPEMKLRASFLLRDGTMIELLQYDSPGSVGAAERRPMNQLGLTHLALVVDDVDSVVKRIVEQGGRAYPNTRVESSQGILAFCTDPDGTRIELWQRP
jgi:predicted enzyme related to lactoylglutathione lyase